MGIDRQTWNETAGYPDSETLDVDSARERFPSLQGPFRSLEVRNGGHVDATLVMRGLTEAAVRLGVEIRPGTLVTGFDSVARRSLRCGPVRGLSRVAR